MARQPMTFDEIVKKAEEIQTEQGRATFPARGDRARRIFKATKEYLLERIEVTESNDLMDILLYINALEEEEDNFEKARELFKVTD